MINEKVVNLLDKTTEKIYTSIDTLEATGDNENITEIIPIEYLNSLNPTCLPPHELRLRKYTILSCLLEILVLMKVMVYVMVYQIINFRFK